MIAHAEPSQLFLPRHFALGVIEARSGQVELALSEIEERANRLQCCMLPVQPGADSLNGVGNVCKN